MFILNPASGIPIYKQLQDQIRRMVSSGRLKPGTNLPSIRELAVKHTINPNTVSKVYSQLESEGYLERHRGKPMTVAAQPTSLRRTTPSADQLQPHLDGLVLAGRELDLHLDELVKVLRKQWEHTNDRNVRRRTRFG